MKSWPVFLGLGSDVRLGSEVTNEINLLDNEPKVLVPRKIHSGLDVPHRRGIYHIDGKSALGTGPPGGIIQLQASSSLAPRSQSRQRVVEEESAGGCGTEKVRARSIVVFRAVGIARRSHGTRLQQVTIHCGVEPGPFRLARPGRIFGPDLTPRSLVCGSRPRRGEISK